MEHLDSVAERLYAKMISEGLSVGGLPRPYSDLDDTARTPFRNCVKAMIADHDSIKALLEARGFKVASNA